MTWVTVISAASAGRSVLPILTSWQHNGLRFTNFYSENMCWVSRAAVLTSIYHKTSLLNSTLHPRCVALPEVLGAAGYRTMICGKWHLAGKNSTVYPNDRGFNGLLWHPWRGSQLLCSLTASAATA